jgi:hypothetical protein
MSPTICCEESSPEATPLEGEVQGKRGAVKVLIALVWASAIAILIAGVYFIGRMVLAADPRDLAIVTKLCGLFAVIFCLLALNPRAS